MLQSNNMPRLRHHHAPQQTFPAKPAVGTPFGLGTSNRVLAGLPTSKAIQFTVEIQRLRDISSTNVARFYKNRTDNTSTKLSKLSALILSPEYRDGKCHFDYAVRAVLR